MVKTLKIIFQKITEPYKGGLLYTVVAIIGLIVRGIVFPLILPSAFEQLTNLVVAQWGLPDYLYILLTAIIVVIFDPVVTKIVRRISYLSAGNFYRQYSKPALGSFLYTAFYAIYTIAPFIILSAYNWVFITVCAAVYLAILWSLYIFSDIGDVLPNNFKLRITVHITLYILITVPMITLAALYPNPF